MAVEDSEENSAKCVCGRCKSYPGGEPWLYCARGKSPKEIDRVECICPECPVWTENDLSGTYYCVSGVE
jgi:Protein of unknown function (DUF2769)